ncbi:MAG: cobalamin-binding protein [Desulfobacteraceae bacterium]|nr:cobalamin B12-binding domain-containing protein [Desulfobacteraceae bacterium]MBC2757205.1 cobalamin-binding protein [Desulfobacteraceae bacterium]
MNMTDILAGLEQSVLSNNPEETARALQAVKSKEYSGDDILNALTRGIEKARQGFKQDKYSIPDLLLAIDAYRMGVNFLKNYPPFSDAQKEKKSRFQIVIGVAEGDVHDLGKNIVAAVLEASGYCVHDMGRNIPNEVFLEKLESTKADVLALSTMMSTPLDNMAELIRMVRKMFPQTAIIVGGAPFDVTLAHQIGADGYAENAIAVPEETKRALSCITAGEQAVASKGLT